MAQKFYDEVQLHDYVHISDMEVSGKEIHSVISEDLDTLKENYQPVRVKDLAELTSGYDTSKGSIEQRLTALGFKQGGQFKEANYYKFGTVTPYYDITGDHEMHFTRQGNYIIGSLIASYRGQTSITQDTRFSVYALVGDGADWLIPKGNTLIASAYEIRTSSSNVISYYATTIEINRNRDNGFLTFYYALTIPKGGSVKLVLNHFGYEAEPINPTTL